MASLVNPFTRLDKTGVKFQIVGAGFAIGSVLSIWSGDLSR